MTAALTSLRRDFSYQALFAGFLAMFVGLSGTLALLIQAAENARLTPAETASWLTAVCVAIGASGIVLSWRYRVPVVTAFSTPGLALLAQSSGQFSYPEVIGALLVTALLVSVVGFTGLFDKVTSRIPPPVAAAVLAGILLPFGLAVFRGLPAQPGLVGRMLGAFVLGRVFAPRYAVPLALSAGLIVAYVTGALPGSGAMTAPPALIVTMPSFSVSAVLVLALPMTLLALAAQHLPGLAVLRASGYTRVPASPLAGWTGVTSLVSALFSAHHHSARHHGCNLRQLGGTPGRGTKEGGGCHERRQLPAGRSVCRRDHRGLHHAARRARRLARRPGPDGEYSLQPQRGPRASKVA